LIIIYAKEFLKNEIGHTVIHLLLPVFLLKSPAGVGTRLAVLQPPTLRKLELDVTLLDECRGEAEKPTSQAREMVSSWAAKYSLFASSSN
jgi:hypothetical protein